MRRKFPHRRGELELIRKICAGETEHFYALIEPYQHAVYAVAYSIVNNSADAEDVAQEAFLKAMKGLPKFRAEAKFSTWLIQIALNEARSRVRRGRAHLHDSLDARPASTDEDFFPKDLADWREIPIEALARTELRGKIKETLASLKPIYREVLVLRDMQHLSVAETAAILGISEDLVKTRLLRARLQMREALAPGYDGAWSCEMAAFRKVRPW